jgi:hypothetical protein
MMAPHLAPHDSIGNASHQRPDKSRSTASTIGTDEEWVPACAAVVIGWTTTDCQLVGVIEADDESAPGART